MMKTIFRHIKAHLSPFRILGTAAALCLLAACGGKSDGEPATTENADRELQMSFLIRVPSMSKYPTRASLPFDEDRENRISEISVIFFSRDAEGNSDRVIMVSQGKSIKRDEAVPDVYSFKVSFYAADPDDVPESVNAVIVANATQDVAAVRYDMTYEQMCHALVRRFPVKAGDYTPLLPAGDEKPLPMWGEVDDVSFPGVNESAAPSYSSTMLRSVARVDVAVDSEIPKERFLIESISVVNGANELAIVPDRNTLEEIAGLPGHWHALSPTIPAGISYAVRWDHDSVGIDNNISHTLYIPECDVIMGGKYGDEKHTRRTAVIVGAHYEGAPSLQYYRMDFMDNDADTLVNVRRNHLYTFHITRVDGEGAESVAAAYNDPAVRLGASLIEWNLPHQSLTYSGEDWISASRESVHLTGNEKAGVVVEVKSSLPLTTFRMRWSENDEDLYYPDKTRSVNGVEADVQINGDVARVAIIVTQENPAGGEPRLSNLVMRITPQLKIVLPVVVHPMYDPGWDFNNPIDGEGV